MSWPPIVAGQLSLRGLQWLLSGSDGLHDIGVRHTLSCYSDGRDGISDMIYLEGIGWIWERFAGGELVMRRGYFPVCFQRVHRRNRYFVSTEQPSAMIFRPYIHSMGRFRLKCSRMPCSNCLQH
ncbi:hypothetical protein P152DRAFT_98818 [Eremomyces bilateralis CBS 781.70]|uniref:Uncharacterized protein n=1 Tax=Eremomyces bilateralis CBS 781.70 TaxID=1392243 RepID=A0A6G1FXQ0_9PEZI|nr:uncharacterized protein P152DRAFT_98818 [Eremomyces bilateralis CBS 781.70]KAF1810446.1 hypothetical protein P152DRAFT_98818 [Eremomyces bilateralis CBS 781.70]